jgi:hypothetical protein
MFPSVARISMNVFEFGRASYGNRKVDEHEDD